MGKPTRILKLTYQVEFECFEQSLDDPENDAAARWNIKPASDDGAIATIHKVKVKKIGDVRQITDNSLVSRRETRIAEAIDYLDRYLEAEVKASIDWLYGLEGMLETKLRSDSEMRTSILRFRERAFDKRARGRLPASKGRPPKKKATVQQMAKFKKDCDSVFDNLMAEIPNKLPGKGEFARAYFDMVEDNAAGRSNLYRDIDSVLSEHHTSWEKLEEHYKDFRRSVT